MFSRILLVAAMTMGAAACVGPVEGPSDPDGNPNPGPNPGGDAAQKAKAAYENEVLAVATAKCGGCHVSQSPVFITAEKSEAYNAIVGWSQLIGTWTPESSGLYTIPQLTAHNGITWSDDEKAKIANWLSLEATARAGNGGGGGGGGEMGELPGQASTRLTREFQKCMTLADFTQSNLGPAIANQQSNEGSCDKCHITGQAAFIANQVTNPDLLPMFNVLKTSPYFLSTYFSVQTVTKPYKINFNLPAFQRVATRQAPHQDHPTFNLTGNGAAGLTAAKAFMDLTLARLDANGNCPTPAP
jgi:hypothetical protein